MHPVLFEFGRISIPSYGVCAALGIMAALLLSLALRTSGTAKHFLPPQTGFDFVLDAVFWTVIIGFVGARAMYIVINLHDAVHSPLAALTFGGGGVFIGGVISGTFATWLVARRYNVNALDAGDFFAPALALGHAFGRLGCFLSGCCYGRPVNLPFEFLGVRYPGPAIWHSASWAFTDHVSRGWISPTATASLPVFPVQLFEAAADLALFGFLTRMFCHRQWRGQIAFTYVLAYCGIRFTLEFLRGDAERGLFGPLSLSQWFCLAAATGILFIRHFRKPTLS